MEPFIQHTIEPETQVARPPVRELALSAAWNGGLARDLTTTTGQRVRVVFRGRWTHGHGPDFSGAMLSFDDGPVLTGDVEIHLQSSDWSRHEHDLDPNYNSVILQIVARDDAVETRRQDGRVVPTVVLGISDRDLFLIDQDLPAIWAELGGDACAPDLAKREPHRLREVFNRLGDARFSERVARYAGDLTVEPLATVLLRGVFDAFGYAMNRKPMATLCQTFIDGGGQEALSFGPFEQRRLRANVFLFGFGGYLPLSPGDAHLAGLLPVEVSKLEHDWATLNASPSSTLSPTDWTRARTRPANHPAARLATLANLLARTQGDPAPILLQGVRHGHDVHALLVHHSSHPGSPALGKARAIAIAATVVLPVFMAWAQHIQDDELEDALSQAWGALPRSEWTRPARQAHEQATGSAPLGPMTERTMQGLNHLDRAFCAPRRCFECPVASEVVADRKRNRPPGAATVQSMLPT